MRESRVSIRGSKKKKSPSLSQRSVIGNDESSASGSNTGSLSGSISSESTIDFAAAAAADAPPKSQSVKSLRPQKQELGDRKHKAVGSLTRLKRGIRGETLK